MGFFGLEMGKQSLMSQQTAIDVTGHNIANANTDGYSRQIADIQSTSYASTKYGTIGSGADVTGIERVRDEFLDDRMIKEKQEKAKWDVRESNLKHLQYIINEPSDQSVRYILDEYWSSLHDLSQNPEDRSIRITVKERAVDLANTVNNTYEQLTALKDDVNNNVAIKVTDINSKLKQIAGINAQIEKVESDGAKANDLRDKRDLLVEDLSKDVNVSVSRGTEYSVIIGGRTAVQGSNYTELKTVKDTKVNGGMYQIKWSDTDKEIYLKNGELKGLVELRDKDINKYTDYLDQLAVGLIDNTNELHKAGFDINGQKGNDFFGEFDTYDETMDLDSDGVSEGAIYKVKGSTVIDDSEVSALSTDTDISSATGDFEINGIQIEYDTDKDTASDLINRINDQETGVVASMGPNNRLILRGEKDSNYVIKSLKDSSGSLLQELGVLTSGNTEYNYEDTTTLAALSSDRTARPKPGAASKMYVAIDSVDGIAAAKGTDTNGDGIADTANASGDGSNAMDIGDLKYQKSIGKYTYADYFESLVSDLGVTAQQASRFSGNQQVLIDNLEQRRQSKIGVSLDEEMANMIKYQHGYNAAAKYISTMNSMLDTLINKL
ncbi:flagellar hook-associated protein FlgK [Haliovirga abyssi]|uniref:Flagellar hook-associated protein 1 n=1 Tax=Haliovirga abyssi TaxID=2996794 RepID=A0AAU9DHP8_9FUSO|nr:flagellar hook-associated protein FlgK [Haliovirga abyssi]BDU51082.1 flagellar hook protein FlgK [Haliovirga abyssi]